MKIEIIRIGNSRGVRLPKSVLQQCGFGATAELSVRDGRVVLSPKRKAREGWAEAFAAAAPGDDVLLPDHLSADWDRGEWRW
ncbi:MAG: AbrB/MazE/SpoVT family DNA-binding domain-containing protein [Rhodospirillaceae bacterium]|nr:AbrB/MazE/SpoVT family DNA-binding domain-containing protein [Rhodospirillaceae bacterium]